MRRIIFFVIAACLLVAVVIGAIYLPLPHRVNNTFEGYLTYENGSEMNCVVNIEGTYKNYLFRDDIFDGTMTVNDTILASETMRYFGFRFIFYDQAARHGYTISREMTIEKEGDVLLTQQCDTVIISCCYDYEHHTETSDEAYRCLIVAPAKTSPEAERILSEFIGTGHLEKFRTWDFQ